MRPHIVVQAATWETQERDACATKIKPNLKSRSELKMAERGVLRRLHSVAGHVVCDVKSRVRP